jgi:hypothetical protein
MNPLGEARIFWVRAGPKPKILYPFSSSGITMNLYSGTQFKGHPSELASSREEVKMQRLMTAIVFLCSLLISGALASTALAGAETSAPSSAAKGITLDPLEKGEYAPGVDWDRFNEILIHPVQIAYTLDFELGSVFHRSRFRPQDIERTRHYFEASIIKALGNRYRITTKPGPNVLRVEAALVNPVSDRTALFVTGSYTSVVSQLSLIVLLRDSLTGEYLHHLDVPSHTGSINLSTRGYQQWNYMRLVFKQVARRLYYALQGGKAFGQF